MQSNIHVILYKRFTYGGRNYKNVLMFNWKTDKNLKTPFYMLPNEDGTWFGLRGQGHVRGTVIESINKIFGTGVAWQPFKDMAKIVQHFEQWPETEIMEHGEYK